MNYIHASQIESAPGIVAGFTTRHGGVSTPPFASLNLSFSSGDDRDVVETNRGILAKTAGFDSSRLVVAGLVHGSDVAIADKPGLVDSVDGLVTDCEDLLLCVTAADCAIVLLSDPTKRIVGACHAGWRGAVAGVIASTVKAMVGLGADLSQMHSFISPCISAEMFEVGPEVAIQFSPEFVFRNKESGKDHVDLSASLVGQLQNLGIAPANIEASSDCTMSRVDRYFSYRGENGNTGRMMGFIGMRPKT